MSTLGIPKDSARVTVQGAGFDDPGSTDALEKRGYGHVDKASCGFALLSENGTGPCVQSTESRPTAPKDLVLVEGMGIPRHAGVARDLARIDGLAVSQSASFRTPRLLDNSFGSLRAQYTRRYTNSKRDNRVSRWQRLMLSYHLPGSLFTRALRCKLSSTVSGPLLMTLTTYRTVRYHSENSIFQLARFNDIQKAQEVFSARTATPNDVEFGNGLTALHVSSMNMDITGIAL